MWDVDLGDLGWEILVKQRMMGGVLHHCPLCQWQEVSEDPSYS